MTGDPLEALNRWREHMRAARTPASAREYAVEHLYEELKRAVLQGKPTPEDLATTLRSEEGIDRRGRALRMLDRLGELQDAIDAVEEGHRRRGIR